ncbi:Crp/Fnr family transcriptional regulator [Maribacter sp. 4G9]|uniref:Crp/Fnr family transcriptional regulator n=1 Tax=Maribacter sp. 4G9 TaxID=1889777 RepID=UPI000C14B0B8|nr:Crp/Fnr family transcriptional regulator [Maribacter sp. 4G9]PIB26881.1 Crp/Fnr family transcriptional regulator [Maribacter sp. 4G9]
MKEKTKIANALQHLSPDLVSEIMASAIVKQIPKENEILREGQYIKVIPIVLEGLIKVFTRHKDKELLLYYIRPNESCIMSFSASLKNEPSKVFAITEEDTTALLLPVERVANWINQFPDINTLFFQQYNLRYTELLDTIHHVLFDKMDSRLFEYLKEKVLVTNNNPLRLSHRQIADELGTAREVISRTMKKLETENLVKQHPNGIEIL